MPIPIQNCAATTSDSTGGAKAYTAVARSPAGKQVWTNIGATDVMDIDQARQKAREAIGRVRAGLSAVEASADFVGHRYRQLDQSGMSNPRACGRHRKSNVC